MPYVGNKRKKNRTHKTEPEGGALSERVPKSFVLRRGKVDRGVRELVEDMREVMLPHTASRLRERKSNSLKDFVGVATQLGVSHLILFSQSAKGNVGLRVVRLPRGPTLSFRVESYATARQVKASQKRPVDSTAAFHAPPLLVLHNFSAAVAAALEPPSAAGVSPGDAAKLVQTTFQAMFPALNPATVRLVDCRRTLLVHRERGAAGALQLRQYLVRAAPVGVSRGVQRLVGAARARGSGSLPNLADYQDVSDYLLSGGGGAGSESEAEEEAVGGRVVLPSAFPGMAVAPGGVSSSKKSTSSATLSALRLSEIGPRLTLRLVKIESGVCEGETLFHAFHEKSIADAEELRRRAAARVALKTARKATQAENVARRDAANEARLSAKRARLDATQAAAIGAAAEGRLGDVDEDASNAEAGDDDADDGGDEDADEDADDDADADVLEDLANGEDGAWDSGDAEAAPVRAAGDVDAAAEAEGAAEAGVDSKEDEEDEEADDDDDSDGTDPGQTSGHAIYAGKGPRPKRGEIRRNPAGGSAAAGGRSVRGVSPLSFAPRGLRAVGRGGPSAEAGGDDGDGGGDSRSKNWRRSDLGQTRGGGRGGSSRGGGRGGAVRGGFSGRGGARGKSQKRARE